MAYLRRQDVIASLPLLRPKVNDLMITNYDSQNDTFSGLTVLAV